LLQLARFQRINNRTAATGIIRKIHFAPIVAQGKNAVPLPSLTRGNKSKVPTATRGNPSQLE
jgi:hypothetical protein